MDFLSSHPSPIFLHNEEYIEFELETYWKKIDKIGNDLLIRMSKEDEPKFYAYLNKICKDKKAELKCSVCNERFYSYSGLMGHGCFK